MKLKLNLIIMMFGFTTSYAQFHTLNIPQPSPHVNDIFSSFEKELLNELSNGGAPGIQVSIMYNGEVYNKSFGYSNFNKKIKANNKTLFKNASTGKVFVAYAAIKLSLLGKLDLDKNISTYISGLNSEIGKLTTRQLITHTSGLKDESDNFGPSGLSQQIKMAKTLGSDKFFGEPGMVFSYSNTNYDLAGAVIESLTGWDFNTAMMKLVFEPLNMKATTYRFDVANPKNVAFGHSGSGPNYSTNTTIPDNARGRASGMALTTAEELNKFLMWLQIDHKDQFDNKLKDAVLEVFSNKKMTGAYWEYGYGLFHSTYCNTNAIWHSGGMPGYKAAFLSVPEQSFSVTVLANGSGINQWNVIKKAVETVINGNCSLISNNVELTDISEEEGQELIGTYTQGIGARIKVFKKEDTFVMSVDGGPSYELKKRGEDNIVTIRENKPSTSYGVFKDKNGKVLYLQYWVRAYPKVNM
ncbi:serine hydrolase [uncultured Psychroserpens sp.]|uniref:serine hydrolase domain-containing protein n=1 Tax=uncultured Psychroserpens sp. TaxID=255436 RepID=UPI00260D2C8C|nr:serine hydrolase domain-containing protein [uncultured Psychroserpens sp.]